MRGKRGVTWCAHSQRMVVTRHHAPTQQEPRASMLTGAGAYGGGGGALSGNHEGHGASAQEMVVVSPNSQEVAELPSECASRQGHCSVVLPYRQPSPETQRFIATWQGALPKNFYIITACVLGCALTIFIGILVPMLVIRRSANIHNAVVRAKEYDAVSAWASVLRDVMIEGFAATRALAGYSISTFPPLQTPTNASDSIPSDKITAYLKRFPRFASLIASKKPAVAIQAICPGGVIAMTHPHDPDTVGRDLMSPSDPTNRYKPSTRETAQSGRYAIVGPRRTTIASLKQIWVIFTRAPLYRNTSKGVIPSQETFWGFVLLVVNVTGALDVMDLDKLAKDHNLDYVLYDTSTESGDTHVIASSLPSGAMQPDYEEFVAESTVTDVLAPHSSLHIAVRSRETYVSLTPTNIILIVVWTLFGSLLLLGISIAAVLWCTATYDAAAHAPKMAPFAMLTIGPCRGEELWDLATDQMAEVTEKLDQVLVRQMERHRAYQIQQVHPLTTSYVTRSVAAAVQMAFSTIEELYSFPIDEPLRRLLGDEGSLLLCYAVHWCTDAAVRMEAIGGGLRYEGPDVVYGGRMWVFAGPNVVTVSQAALPSTTCMPHVKSKLFDSVFLRGVTTRQDLYVVTDTSNHSLKEAEAFAADQLRRSRQAQLRYVADKEADLGSTGYTRCDRLLTSYPRTGYDSSDLDSSFFAREASAYSEGATSGSGNDSNPISVVNSSGGGQVASGAARRGARKDGVAGVSGVPTAIVVPASTPDNALVVAGADVSESASTLSRAVPQRRMGCRPPRDLAAANVVSGSSRSSSSAASVGSEKEETSPGEPPTPLLQPVSPEVSVTAATGTVRPRRGQDNAHTAPGATASGSNSIGFRDSCSGIPATSSVRHHDLLLTNPLVVVPPAVTVDATAHGLCGGGGSASTTPISGESTGGRHSNFPTCGDNPLAHGTTAAAAAKVDALSGGITGLASNGGRGAVGGTPAACRPGNSEGNAALQGSGPALDNFSDLLLRPAISTQSDLLLRAVFDRQAVALDLSYDSVRVLVYYFYSSYKILFRPLAAPELHNIYRRLMTAFGVPQQGILEHLAARCATRFLQRHEETQTLLWDQQHRLQMHIRSAGATAATATSVSDDGVTSTSG